MKIITYSTTDADVPEGMRHIARIRCLIPTKGKLIEQWHPVIFNGSDPEALREQAQAWWDAELSAAAAKKPRGRPKGEAPKKPCVPTDAVSHIADADRYVTHDAPDIVI